MFWFHGRRPHPSLHRVLVKPRWESRTPFFRVLCWTSGPPPAPSHAESGCGSGPAWIHRAFVADVLWADACQLVSPTQPSFAALDVLPLCPLVCGSRRLGGRALTGRLLSPGHEVPVLPALPSLRRGRHLLAAQHQVQEVRAPAGGAGPAQLRPQPGPWLPGAGPSRPPGPSRLGSTRGSRLTAGHTARVQRGRGLCTVVAPSSQPGRPPAAPVCGPGSGPPPGCVVLSHWRSSGEVCQCPVSAVPSVGAPGAGSLLSPRWGL